MYHLIEHGIGLRLLTVKHKNLLAATNKRIIAPEESFVNPFCDDSMKFSVLAIS